MEGIKILLYHSVGDVDPRDELGIRIETKEFRHQMQFLKDNYDIWTLKEAVDCIRDKRPIPQRIAVITFDDGYKDNILEAVPIMKDYGFRATFFVTIDLIGRVKTHPDRPWQHWGCMDWDDLKALVDRGHDIGSHGYHHIDLCKSDSKTKTKELRRSKEKMNSALDRDIDFFSYPYGYFDNKLTGFVKSTGYKAACTTMPGPNTHSTDLYKLRRIEITARDTVENFEQKLVISFRL